SLSAFLRVAQPTDPSDSLYCDLWMAYNQNFAGFVPVDPIDSLQTLYNHWKVTLPVKNIKKEFPVKVWSASDGNITFDFSRCPDFKGMILRIYDITGRLVSNAPVTNRTETLHPFSGHYSGLCFYQITAPGFRDVIKGKLLLR
ncbi:MAG: hypothetical protein WCL00_01170, partial [Bacteroidota bacterium]